MKELKFYEKVGLFVVVPVLFGLWINGNLGAWFG
jgi:hypothetical protein